MIIRASTHAGAATFAAYAHGTEALISGNVDRDFVADLENRGSSFYVYTPTRTLTLYAPDLEAQRAWVAALRAAGEQVYDAEELKAKATALQEMAPLLLDQAQRQFKRMHQILASLKCTGYVVQDERVKSLKKVRDSASFPDVSELQVASTTPRRRRRDHTRVYASRAGAATRDAVVRRRATSSSSAPSTRTSSSTASCSRILLRVNRASPRRIVCCGATRR